MAERAADQLRTAILRGAYEPGTDLPGERDLAEQLSVSRLTLRAALAHLESEGLVKPVHGSGTRVLDFRDTGSIALVGHIARASLEQGRLPVALLGDLMELRRSIAVEALSRSCERGTDQELAELRMQLERLREVMHDPATFMSADLRFAQLVVRAARNLPLILVVNTITRALFENPGLEAVFSVDPASTLEIYERILDLIDERDAEAVRAYANAALLELDERTLNALNVFAQGMTSERGEEAR